MSRVQSVARVLYADDLREAVVVPASVLESLGPYDVTQARSADAAVDRLDSEPYDCVVVGTDLQDGDWRSVVEAVRSEGSELPVIVVGCDGSGIDPSAHPSPLRLVQQATLPGTDADASGDGSSAPPASGSGVAAPTLLHATLELVAAQIDRLVDLPSGEPPLAAIPDPAFLYDEGFVGWNEPFGDLIEGDDEWLAERPLGDVFDCTPSDLARAAGSTGTLAVTRADVHERGATTSLSVGRSDGQYLCIVEDASTETGRREAWSPAAMLDSLLAELPLAIYFKDRRGRHVDVSHYQVGSGHEWAIENPEGKVHHAPEDVVGKTDFDLYPASRAEESVEVDEQVVETESVHVEEGEIVTVQEMEEVSARSVKDLAMTTIKAPWYDADGDVAGVVGVTLNVTERWEAERRADVGDAILETIETILETQVRPEVSAPADDAEAGGQTPDPERLERVLADLEVLLRTRHQPESTEIVDLGAVAREVWGEIEPEHGTLSGETSGLVDAHPTQLRALLGELFENALVHGGPDPEVVLGELDDGFYVEDDGPGIPPARRSDVFEYGTTSAGDDGVGGGLALVEAIARSHDWSVEVTDGAREGARVVVSGVDFY